MGDLTQAGLDTVVNKLDEVSDKMLEAIDATQNAGFESLEQLVEAGGDLGDLAVANLREAKERAESLVRAYAKVLGAISPV